MDRRCIRLREGFTDALLRQEPSDLEAQAVHETVRHRRLPAPIDVLTERVFQLRALAESSDLQSARAALKGYFKGGTITMTPEPHGDGEAYVALGEFLPLVLLTENAATPSSRSREGVVVHE